MFFKLYAVYFAQYLCCQRENVIMKILFSEVSVFQPCSRRFPFNALSIYFQQNLKMFENVLNICKLLSKSSKYQIWADTDMCQDTDPIKAKAKMQKYMVDQLGPFCRQNYKTILSPAIGLHWSHSRIQQCTKIMMSPTSLSPICDVRVMI